MRDSWMTSADPDSLEVTAEEPIYLSLDGAVDPARLDVPEYPVHFSTAYVYSVSDRGITSQMFAASRLVGEFFGVLDPNQRYWWDEYLRAWSAGDPSAVQGSTPTGRSCGTRWPDCAWRAPRRSELLLTARFRVGR